MTEPAAPPPAPAPESPGTPPAAPANPPPVATRPDWLPEAHWDPQGNAIKPEFGKHYGELATFHKTETERRAALPQKPEDVKIELPKDFKIPDGAPLKREDIRIDEKDPRLPVLRDLAVKHAISPEAVNELFALDARMKIEDQIAENARVAAEDKKLGANAPARKAAVGSWLDGLKTKGDLTAGEHAAAAAYATDADAVSFLEKIMAKAAGSVPAAGGAPPAPPKADLPLETKWYAPQQKVS